MENTEATKPGFAGTLSNVQLSDILQMMCLEGASTVIRVTHGDRVGTINLVSGEIIHAECEEMVGKSAFYKIMGWGRGSFESIQGSVPDRPTIVDNWQFLLIEACRRTDEDIVVSDASVPDVDLVENNNALYHDQIAGKGIRVLIVDDSAIMRKALVSALEGDEFKIVGTASNGTEALELIPQVNPDVVTMDINMPVMDGISALKRIMIKHPIPTVMVSALTQEGAGVTFDALKFGAVDFISKPSQMKAGDREAQSSDIRDKVRLASKISINSVRYIRGGAKSDKGDPVDSRLKFVASVGAGEGGYGALLKIIPQFAADLPVAVVVVLYAAPAHVDAFARYLNDHSRVVVKRARNSDQLQGGTCYLASGMEYTTIKMVDEKPTLQITPSPFKDHRGSADILMISLAEKMGVRAMGVVLSGASDDGAEGVKEIFHAGGTTLIQDPSTCLMEEMAEAALASSENARVVSDEKIAAEVARLVSAGISLDSIS